MTLPVRRLVGVYNAKSGLLAAATDALRKLVGRSACALCDLTHGVIAEKAAFRACREGLPVPLELLHDDEQPTEIEQLTRGPLPCVLAETEAGSRILLDRAALAATRGDWARLEAALLAALAP